MLTRKDTATPQRTYVGNEYVLLGHNDIALPVVAGTYRYQVDDGRLPPYRFVVPQGEQVDINVDYDAFLGRALLQFEDRGGLPDAAVVSGSALMASCGPDYRPLARPDGAGEISTSYWAACRIGRGPLDRY